MNLEIEQKGNMEQITNTILAVISKPVTGASLGLSAAFLTWLGIITAGIGVIAAIFGLGAAIYSFLHNRNLVKEDKKRMRGHKK